MKQMKLLFMAFIAVFLLAGCGSKSKEVSKEMPPEFAELKKNKEITEETNKNILKEFDIDIDDFNDLLTSTEINKWEKSTKN